MANENIFTTKASEYAASRPSYAPEAIDRIVSKMLRAVYPLPMHPKKVQKTMMVMSERYKHFWKKNFLKKTL